jgi:hypothetical protein
MNILKRPPVIALLLFVLGVGIGLMWGWVIQPVEWVDASPSSLRSDFQEDYLRMAIDSFRVNRNPNLAVQRWQNLGSAAPAMFSRIQKDPRGLDNATITLYYQVIQTVLTPGAAAPPARAGSAGSIILGISAVLILGVAITGFIFLRRLLTNRTSSEVTPGMQATEINREAAKNKTNFESMGVAPPITQNMTTYVLGDDLYDESFSIDTQGGDFLGEYGVGVSETIGVGDPKKVTALEIWLFDKNDIKTATKVLMTAHAYNDPGIRARLEPKGELILVEPQKQIILETETLQLLANVVDLQYGEGAMPRNSFFERLTLELAVWPKGS